ncbi:MAG: hypothetical protein O9342_00005 [Beijerinckiaceae bacterium]|nr:hypothetical protein [Beijerinckiaceae bacterium]
MGRLFGKWRFKLRVLYGWVPARIVSASDMASLKSTEIAKALSSAKDERRLMRLTTRYDNWFISGYVVGLGPGFVMILVVNDRVWLDGFECLRRNDIVGAENDPYAEFQERALTLRGETIPDIPPVSLVNIEDMLETAGRAFPLITVHCEAEDPEVCYIGHVHEVLGGELVMRNVTPAAKWEPELERYPTSSITRVAFGGDYEEALWAVAGDPPLVDQRTDCIEH